MNMRLALISLAGSMVLASANTGATQTSWQPTESVEFVVPYAVGGGADLFARILAETMVKDGLVPVPVQVVNRPGGGSAVGVGYVMSTRQADPHTLVLVNSSVEINSMVVPEAPGLKDLLPIYNFMLDDFIIVVRADAEWQSAADLATAARELPPKTISVGVGGPVGGENMNSQAFGQAAGFELNRVAFNSGGEVLTALLGGHVDLAITNPIEYIGHLQSGAVRAIGVLRDERYPELPDVATLEEQGIVVDGARIWRGVAMPQGVPDEAVAYWVEVMDKLAASEPIRAYLRDNLVTGATAKGEELTIFLEEQREIYRNMLAQ